MHSDVGGGYSNDSLSYVSLEWMMSEAEKAGLRFAPETAARFRQMRDDCGPMHDSRRGAGGYYRYQPRRIDAVMPAPPAGTRIMCDPRQKPGLLQAVKLHRSVVERIRASQDGYAPIVVPSGYAIVGGCDDAIHAPSNPTAFATRREAVWNEVWKKRVTYFALVGVSLVLVLLPFLETRWPAAPCTGPTCLVGNVVIALGTFLPALASPWIDAFARRPNTFLALAAVIAALTAHGRTLQRRIGDLMGEIWNTAQAAAHRDPRRHWIYRLRTHRAYQAALQFLKWKLVPALFGLSMLVLGPALALLTVDVVYQRARLQLGEASGATCDPASTSTGDRFRASDVCWDARAEVRANTPYRVTFVVQEPWFDGSVPATPLGLAPGKASAARPLWVPLRRVLSEPWFTPMAKVVAPDGRSRIYPLAAHRIDAPLPTYVATFVPTEAGAVRLFVNDAILSLHGLSRAAYADNRGEATVTIAPLAAGTGP
jgi:hypothetical protein